MSPNKIGEIIMKLFKFSLASIILMFAGTAYAQNSAYVLEGGGCGLFQGDGTTVVVIDADNNFVGTGSKNGTTKITCHASGVVPAPGPGPFKASGFACGVILQDGTGVITTDSQALVTPDGESLLKCWIH